MLPPVEMLEEAVMEDPTASLLFTQYKAQFGLQAEIDRQLELEVAVGQHRPQPLDLEIDAQGRLSRLARSQPPCTTPSRL